ncbi:MAG: DUF5060 domain-containing protein [Chitinivibrionales bacterium]|nr:DUF5060 domain-containing protein [Chitinivibrionales bacterium]
MFRSLPVLLLTFVTLTVYATNVKRYDVYEHTITHSSSAISNVWEDVTVAVKLTAPSGKTFSIGGFYYDTNTWKFRFSPNETGTWNWEYSINSSGKKSGTFNCVASDNPGCIKLNPDNPYRWVHDNGEPFYVFGTQDCIEFSKYSFNELAEKNWKAGGSDNLTFDEYLDVFQACGFNLWRLNNGNCSPKLIVKLDPAGNSYDAKIGRLFDKYAQKIRAHGMRIFNVIFEWSIPFAKETSNTAKMDALKRYVTYFINRYGAYTDFWELANEYKAKDYNDKLIDILAEHVKKVDPYQPSFVSVSWQRDDIASLDIISPHAYISPQPASFETGLLNKINQWKKKNKPIIYGELGNYNCSHENLSTFRWRVIMWSLFFSEASGIFWHQHSTDYCPNSAANLYLHPDLQKYFKYYTDWRAGFDSKAKPGNVSTTVDNVRIYSLTGPKHYGLYIFDYSSYDKIRTGLKVTIAPQGTGSGTWANPKTGEDIDSFIITKSGAQTVTVPDFKADIALKITLQPTSIRN